MSEFETIASLFPEDRQPTRELEPIQKVDRTDEIERDVEEFYETPSARRVLEETATIVEGKGLPYRFRYVHATFGSGKSHLLKLIGVATGEMDDLEAYAHQLANSTSGFKQFRDSLAASGIDHLQPLFMNLLDRDREETSLDVMLFEELCRRRGYPMARNWLLEFCWRLEFKHGLWADLREHEYEGLHLHEVVDIPSSLRPWLTAAIPELDAAAEADLDTPEAVEAEIESAETTMQATAFGPDDLVERLRTTRRSLEEQPGETHEFLIGLDEIAIYVGDQPRRYDEVVKTITALIEGVKCPILGTGQWSMRDMQRRFVGEVDDDAWYAKEVQLEGADTETIVRKRWLQKSEPGRAHLESILAPVGEALEPTLHDEGDSVERNDPIEAYPFRDHDLALLRSAMEGLITGDRETDREYIQGRALLVRVRSLFVEHGWADREPGALVSWDELFDVIDEDTELIPSWATDLIDRVKNTFEDPLASRTAKGLFLLSQTDSVPRTAENLARLLATNVDVDLDDLVSDVEAQLDALVAANLIREAVDETPPTYTILSERDIRFWQEVQQAAADMPEHQLRSNIQQFLQEVDPSRLSSSDVTTTGTFGAVEDVAYTVRYSIDRRIPDSVPDQYDAVVIRLLADDESRLADERERWQAEHREATGREDVLVAVDLTEALRQQVRQLVGMRTVLKGMADPRPEYRLQRQAIQEDIEDTIQDRLYAAQVFVPGRSSAFGSYLETLDDAVEEAVEKKFEERKYIERSLQLDDLHALVDFFDDEGPWPFTEADAELLGVNTVPGTITDGWVTEFLDLFDDDERVSGERVLETIEGRRGAFLGTPPEALHALLFVLVADNRIEVRTGGERVTDLDTIARLITRRTRLKDAVIGFDPEGPPEGLEDVYEALLDETPDSDNVSVMLDGIAAWAERNASRIRTVVSRVNLTFDARYGLDELENALEPAFAGQELDAPAVSSSSVIEEAKRYRKVAPLFVPAEAGAEPLWDRFEETFDDVRKLYPTSTEVSQMQVYAMGSNVPDQETLKRQLEKAHELRVTELQTLYERFTGTSSEAVDVTTLRESLTEALTDASFEADLDRVEEQFEAVTFSALRELLEAARDTSQPLDEPAFADERVRSEAVRFARGRELLDAKREGSSLYEQLVEMEATLAEDHEGFVTTQIRRAVSGEAIPAVERANQLLDQGEHIISGADVEDGADLAREDLWSHIEQLDDGSIVVLDLEASK